MTPNTIIRLIQGAYQIGARIGERETLPAAYMMKPVNSIASNVVGIR